MSTNLLDALISDALAIAGNDDSRMHNGRLWKFAGGRRCPLDWDDCSQAVFRCAKSDDWDYGEPGGPGHAECVATCPHGMHPPEVDEEPEEAAPIHHVATNEAEL
ncbi:hypothetical protein LJR084_001858 [Variovorax sp. LjRoot84]|uniref:hypothetical protein n=1 Tax=Variovorax sp. LjRoot84 TaxID=3342340 RepID=UPI003ECE2C75